MSEEDGRVVECTAGPGPGPQTTDEVHHFHQGFLAGATAYAVAAGHSGIKTKNDVLKKVFEEQSWKTFDEFERVNGSDKYGIL